LTAPAFHCTDSVPVVVMGPPLIPAPLVAIDVTVPDPGAVAQAGSAPEPAVRRNCPLVPGARPTHPLAVL
jgi:hypothetical protein